MSYIAESSQRMTLPVNPQPGDFGVVTTKDATGRLIEIGEILAGGGGSDYEHAFWYIGGPEDLILEAEVPKAVIVPYHYEDKYVLWSSTVPALALTDAQRHEVPAVAMRMEGTPYSAADYFAIAAHRLHIPAPGLKHYIASSKHMICSQLVDYCRLLIGSHLFADGRWPGYVMPEDLAQLIINLQ